MRFHFEILRLLRQGPGIPARRRAARPRRAQGHRHHRRRECRRRAGRRPARRAVVAPGQPRAVADRRVRMPERTGAVRRRDGDRVGKAHTPRTDAGGGCARLRRGDHPCALRGAARQGRRGRPAAPAGPGTAVGGRRTARCAHQPVAAQEPRDHLDRPGWRPDASPGLAAGAERGAVEGEPGGGRADARRLAGAVPRGRCAARPDVWQRHAADRRRTDGRRRGPGPAAPRQCAADPLVRLRCGSLAHAVRRRRAARSGRAQGAAAGVLRQ